MLKKDKTKPFRIAASTGPTDPESPTNPTDSTGPTAEEMLMNCAVSKLKADRTPIPDNRFILPPEYGVDGDGSSDTTDEYEYNGHEYVDLGLPSGTLWAKMNVGAESETDAGLYFAWGETTGYPIKEVDGSWVIDAPKQFKPDDYAFTENNTVSKYNASDNKTHLELTDDAAAANMGGDWHMPNIAQCVELLTETKNGFVTNTGAFTQFAWDDTRRRSNPTQTTTTISGWDTAGYFFFKSDVSDMNAAITSGDYLFIPAAGECRNGETYDVGDYGYVWTSTLNSSNVYNASDFYFNSNRAGIDGTDGARYFGFSVRGVVGQMDEINPGGGGIK